MFAMLASLSSPSPDLKPDLSEAEVSQEASSFKFQISKSDATQFQSKHYACSSFVSVFAFLSRHRAPTYRIGKLLCRSKEQSPSSSSSVLSTNSLSPLPPPIYKLRLRQIHHQLQFIIQLLSGCPYHHLPCMPCVYSRNRSMEPFNEHLHWV
jgi:hypothetical protein